MRSLRILFLVVFLSLVLSIPVPLRSGAADDSVCKDASQAYYILAQRRDAGVSFELMMDSFAAALAEGKITFEGYATLVQAAMLVYRTDKTPEEIRDMVKRVCLASQGKVEA